MKVKTSLIRNILLLVLSIVFILFMLLINDMSIQIHIKELKVLFQQSNEQDNSLDHIGLVMSYQLNKKLYENKITQHDADKEELKVNTLLSNEASDKKVDIGKYGYAAYPLLGVINILRSFMGKGAIQDTDTAKVNVYLTLAYYYERNKYYDKALKIYEKAIKEARKISKKAGIILHQGFCYAIRGEYKQAKKKYKTIINKYSKEDVVVTAVVLLRYLEGFQAEVRRIKKLEKNNLDKSEKLYKLLAYKESIKVLDSMKEKISNTDRARASFLKGRCLEELGKKNKAIKIYQKIITDNSQSKYARTANSRIYIIGAREYNKKIRKLAVKNNKIIQDENFDKMVKDNEVIYIEDNFQNRLESNPLLKTTYSKFNLERKKQEKEEAKLVDAYIAKVDRKIKGEELDKENSNEKKEIKRKIVKKSKKKIIKKKVIKTVKKIKKVKQVKKIKKIKVIKKVKKVKKKKTWRVRVFTHRGEVFVGDLLRRTKTKITIKTILGKITIERSKIKMMTRLK